MFKYYDSFPPELQVDSLTIIMNDIPLSKDDFLELIAKKLQFSDCFGKNWDALTDCLSDLSWFKVDLIRLVFPVLPLKNQSDMVTFLSVLVQCRESLRQFGVELQPIFLQSDHPQLKILLREALAD